jgi:hypothetical protein
MPLRKLPGLPGGKTLPSAGLSPGVGITEVAADRYGIDMARSSAPGYGFIGVGSKMAAGVNRRAGLRTHGATAAPSALAPSGVVGMTLRLGPNQI